MGSCAKEGTTDSNTFYCGTGSNCNEPSGLSITVLIQNFLTLTGTFGSIDPDVLFESITEMVFFI